MDGDGHLADGGFLSRDAEARIRSEGPDRDVARSDGRRGAPGRGAEPARLDAVHPRRPDATESSFPPVDGTRGDGVVRRVGVVRASARRRVVLLLVRTSRARARPGPRARAARRGGGAQFPRGVRASPSDDSAPGDPPAPKRGNRNRRNRRNRRGSSTSEPGDAGGPSKPRRPPRASEGAVALASAASTTARFMGTLDADDELAPNLPDPSTPARAAVFKGTIDDGDLDIFAGGRAGGDRGESSSPAALTPPPDGNPDLAFLYDPETVASVASDPSAGVNAPEVVGPATTPPPSPP